MLFRKLFQSSAPVAPVPAAIPSAPAVEPQAPAPAPVDHSVELKALQDSLAALQTENAAKIDALTGELSALKTQLAEVSKERDDAKALAAQTREEITQQVKQQEMAILAASQGVPLSQVPPESNTDPVEPKETRESLMEQYKNSRDNRERGEIIAKLKTLK